ncbi:hypothetical protein [Amycolatopsis sp. DSM 110486]|uniref:hypothetical protein n=1 Tax=Amycolatopsis sp. DSM 110486 TaxID=2865832 RepID=UPI001C69C785|nr:hypothetical protein [Amycolatopsis sp. DSM 110486]QYN17520.1 hypothetical protein K1T34_32560 [Amycolatopsis sp. DSM 110486]
MARRNPKDRGQQRAAWHELGHALVDDELGLRVVKIVLEIDFGYTRVHADDHQWREYAIACMAGWEAEKLWEKHHNGWFGCKSPSQRDYELFREAVQGRRFSEEQAQAAARKILRRKRDVLEELAPRLIVEGGLMGRDLR